MSRLVVPLHHHILWATGDLVLRARLVLRLKDGTGGWHRVRFRVDSASDLTTMSAFLATQMGLPIPKQASPAVKHEQTGLEIRSGYLRAQIVGMDQTEYAFPCFFLGDPAKPPNLNAPKAMRPRNLLGLSGVVNQVRITFEGTPLPPTAPHGVMIVEKL